MFFKFILKSLRLLPFWILKGLSYFLGVFLFLIPNYYKSVSKINLKIAFPDKNENEINNLTFKSLVHSTRSLLETGNIWYKKNHKSLEVGGQDHIRSQLKKKSGAVLFTPHLGNIESIISFLGDNFNCFIPYTPSKNSSFERVMLEARRGLGVTMVKANFSGIRKLYTALQEGGVIAIASDQVPNKKNGIISNFFGQPALTMTLVSSLVNKTKCPCHLVYSLRGKGDNSYKIFFSEEMDFLQGLSHESFINRMNRELENCIMNAPEQYSWEYKRYKHSGPVDPYK